MAANPQFLAATERSLRRTRNATIAIQLGWLATCSFWVRDLPPAVGYTLLVCVSLLLVAVPAWLVGKKAKRDYLAAQA